ncbi:MAG: GNAT family N-acetyltransferase [Fimbriimonadaceae bacterium]|nr:GNAT family N-acetyltransferase [Fimbriimonadaceae bacterium]
MAIPFLETARLRLRPWTSSEGDVRAAFAMYGDPEVMRYLGNDGQAVPDLETLRERLGSLLARNEENEGLGFCAAEELATGEVMGTGILHPIQETETIEVGWHLRRAAWGRGFATEIGARLLRYGHEELGLGRIVAVAFAANVASLRVMRKLGMSHRGTTDAYYGVELELYESNR